MKLSITLKVVGALIGTLLVCCGAVLYTCLHYLSIPLEQELDANIRRVESVVRTTNQATMDRFVNAAALLADHAEFPRAVAAKDYDKVRAMSRAAMQRAASDFMTVTDDKGKVIARGHSAKRGDDVTNQETVVVALGGKPAAAVVAGTEVPFTIRASQPIMHEGKLVGTLSIGTSLVTPAYIDWLKSMGALEVTIFKGDTRVMTTIQDKGGRHVIGTKMQTPEIIEDVLSKGKTIFTRNNILGLEYKSAYWPIRDLNGKITGMWFVGAPLDSLLRLEMDAIHTTLLVTCGLLLIMLALAVFLGTRLAAPIKKITAYARQVAAGNTEARLDVHTRDDVGALADVLRTMVAKLKRQARWYQDILDCIPFSVSITDMNRCWTFVNKSGLDSMGKRELSSIVGKPCAEKGGSLCNTPDCGIEALARGDTEVVNRQPDGQVMRVRMAYLTDDAGNPIGHVEVGMDITEEERLKKEAAESHVAARRETATQLEAVVTRLSAASRALAGQITGADHGATDVTRRMGETAEAMEEMNATVTEVARNAAEAAQASHEVRDQAQSGDQIVESAVSDIQRVRRQSLALKTDMEALDEQARNIGAVLTMIRDIADQTNLLALNAAIEAARAGEAGRGFAVVADEVRKLAEKSMAATKDVEQAIAAIQQGTAHSVDTVDGAVRAIEDATSLAQKSGEALRSIVRLSGNASAKVQSIATAAEQQAATTQNVNSSVETANREAERVSGTMHDAMHEVEELTRQAQVLQEMLEEMLQSTAGVGEAADISGTAGGGFAGNK